MKKYRDREYCIECKEVINTTVFNFSTSNFGTPLCMTHQDLLREKMQSNKITTESLMLYFALKQREVPAHLEKYDGFKTIDIAVPHARVNIEVDGPQHNMSPKQALADLKRTYFSFKKGYFTLRIPNTLVKENLEETADMITEILVESRERNNP